MGGEMSNVDGNGDGNGAVVLTFDVSKDTLINLWVIMMVCLVINCIVCLWCNHKHNEKNIVKKELY